MVSRRPFTPRGYQDAIMEWALDRERSGVWAGMGMGKTVSTLTALDILELVEPGPALVLAPLRVAASTWPDEASKWDHLHNVEVSAVVGTPEKRRAALRRPASVFTTNYENLPWLIEHLGDKWPFRKVVADEATKLKSFRLRQGGKRAQALGRVAHSKVSRFIELTGTPSPNGLQDLWGQAWFLDQGVRLGRTYDSFRQRWFQAIPGGDGYQQIRPLPHAQREIEERLRDLCLSLDARDYFDIREPIVNVIRVDLPSKVRKLYRDMEREMFMQIDEHEVEAFSAAARTIKCLQLANGAAYTDDGGSWTEVHDAKLQALESVIEEAAGAPVLVAYHFKSDLARLQHTFPRGRVLDKDPQTIRDWNAGKIPVLFAHPASAGHGLNLQDGGNILAFFGHWWNLEEFQQIVERIGPTRQAQAGHDRPVFIHHIVAADTVDELVMARRETKREVQDLLLEAMKRRA
ncbi:SNF2-related protein [Ralstonia syzygii]|uniref:SNF2-related protein n=1 Tax=Ralstonia syzygii TaxID=28097 RepID=UPI0035177052